MKCARCHDHKFDPILQSDYYRIASFFWVGPIGQANQGGPTKEQLGFDVYGWTDLSPAPKPIRLLQQGERHKPGAEITPGFLSAVAALDKPLPSAGRQQNDTSAAAVPRWITDAKPAHGPGVGQPRLATSLRAGSRSYPKQLWLQERSPDAPQTARLAGCGVHAAHRRRRPGWTIKRLHKLIMTSETYQQASVHANEAEYSAMDFTNRNWWKFPRRRLDPSRSAMPCCRSAVNSA